MIGAILPKSPVPFKKTRGSWEKYGQSGFDWLFFPFRLKRARFQGPDSYFKMPTSFEPLANCIITPPTAHTRLEAGWQSDCERLRV